MLQEHMVSPGMKILAGVSGGADSVCLLVVLVRLRERLGCSLEAVTVHHGIRGEEAERDVEQVGRLCRSLAVPLHLCRVDVPAMARELRLSEEEAGRKARYDCFERLCRERGARRIAVAHQQEDNCETILHHLLRGSGLRGLAGISPVRDKIIRPLLTCSRSEIEDYLTAGGFSWCEDSTNALNCYSRNKIRNQLLPWLSSEINSRAAQHILSAGELIGQSLDYIDAQTDACYRELADRRRGQVRLEISGLADCHPVIRESLYHRALSDAGLPVRDVGRVHMAAVDALRGRQSGRRVELPGGGRVWREYGSLVFGHGAQGTDEAAESGLSAGLEIGVQELEREGSASLIFSSQSGVWEARFRVFRYEQWQKIPENTYTKWFDYDRIGNKLILRCPQPGDYLTIAPDCRRKKLTALMKDCRIPAGQRAGMPVLAAGSQIVWLLGYRISECFKVTPGTRRVLQVQVSREQPELSAAVSNDTQ